MKKLKYALVLIPLLLLSGCYESEIPLSESSKSHIDARLIKSWISLPKNNNEDVISLMIWKFNEKECLVVWKEGEDGERVLTRGFTTIIKNTNIINLQNIKSFEKNDRTYVFFKYDFNEKENLVVNILSNEYSKLKGKKFESTDEFRDFIQRNLGAEGLFESSIEFRQTNELSFEING